MVITSVFSAIDIRTKQEEFPSKPKLNNAQKSRKEDGRAASSHRPVQHGLGREIILRRMQGLPGVKIDGRSANVIRCTDDAVLVANSVEKLQKGLNAALNESANQYQWH